MPEHPNPWRSQPPTSISSLLPSFARSTEEGRYANSTCFAVLLCSAPHGSEYKGRRQRPGQSGRNPQEAAAAACRQPRKGRGLVGSGDGPRGVLDCFARRVASSFRFVSFPYRSGSSSGHGRASKHMWDFFRGHRRRGRSGRARPVTSRGGGAYGDARGVAVHGANPGVHEYDSRT